MGILGSAYRALDPLLPFDRQLDPRFGNGILSRDDASGRGILSGPQMAPPMASQAPQAGVMGFPAVPGPQAPQGPQASPEKPYKPSLVDMIWGVAAGYSPGATRRALMDDDMKRRAAQAGYAQSQDMRARQMAFAQTLDPREQAVFMADPEAWAKAAADRYKPMVVADGSAVSEGGDFRRPDPLDYTLKPGEMRLGGANNQPVASAPFAPEIIKLVPGETGTVVDFSPSGSGGGGGPSRGVRNNNAGNLKDGSFARSLPGYKGADAQGFAIFDTPEAGIAAQERLLAGSYVGQGINTPSAIIARYAPVGAENTPEQVRNYTAYVAGRLGVAPDQPIPPEKIPALAAAMREFETGSRGPRSQVVASGGPAPSVVTLTPQEVQAQNLPPGVYQRKPDGTIVPVQGSVKDAATTEKETAARQLAISKGRATLDVIGTIFPRINAATAGFGGGMTKAIPGTPAFDLQSDINTIKANLAFDALQAMRAASPTGGALGSTSEREITLLESAVSSLDVAQSPDQLRRNLQRVRTHYQNWLKTLEGQQAPSPAAPARPVRKPAPGQYRYNPQTRALEPVG